MRRVEENIIIGDNSLNYDELVANISKLSIKNITDILLESRITLPRKLNVTALRLALNEKIVIAKSLNLSDEELFRLRFYPFFNEYQLQKLFVTFYDDKLFDNYRKFLVELILQNDEYLRLEDNLINKILNVPNKFEDFSLYQDILKAVSYDFDGYFDGIKFEDYDENILKSLTSDDIRQLGLKYGITIPKRLKKDELIAYVKEVMEINGKVIPEDQNLDSQSIMMVQRFAKKNNIKISADLKKDECINYLFHLVNKLNLEYRKEVLLNLYLGDSFVFDLAYVTKVEEKPQVEAEPAVVEPVVEEKVETVLEQQPIEVISEEPETKVEEVTEEPVKTEEKTVVVTQPMIDPEALVSIITKSVKEIVVDVVKEIVPLFKEQPKEEPKTDEQLVEEKIYNYDNFVNQKNPNYDQEIHQYIKNYDCKTINPNYEEIKVNSEKFVMEDLAEETPEVVLDDTNMTEEEKAEIKKQKKEAKRQAKIDAKNLSKEEKARQKEMSIEERRLLKEEKQKEKEAMKLEKKAKKAEEKAQAKQAKIDEKLRQKEEKAQAKIDKKVELEQNKLRAKEEKKENKLKLKEDRKVQKETEKQNKILAKKEAKRQEKEAKLLAKEEERQAKIREVERRKNEERNYKELQKVLQDKGEITKIDQSYLESYFKIHTLKQDRINNIERINSARKERNAKAWKLLIFMIFFSLLCYVGFGAYLAYFKDVVDHPIYTAIMNNPFLKWMFEPFVEWFSALVPNFKAGLNTK